MRGVFSLLTIVATAVSAIGIAPGDLLFVAPCDASDPNQHLRVSTSDGTVRSSDGSLCVSYIGESPIQLAMAACVPGSGNQSWPYAAAVSAFEGTHGGSCVAWNSQGDISSPIRPLSTWTCESLQWNGFFTPDASRGVIVANCSSPGDCTGTHCIAAIPPPPSCNAAPCFSSFNISDIRGPARVYEGVGGLSGGGAVARLLPMYSDAVRSEILDYLFLPNFGASLQVLKVEIGSDCQSTDGSEATHMRSPTDSNFSRGYEWMMMREAKARNPDIKIYGLAWGFPRWVTCLPSAPMQNCTGNVYSYPEQTAAYLVAWVAGAKAQHNITIDFIGDYNEREYSDSFIKLLRASLDAAGFHSTRIVYPDEGGWDVANDVLADPTLASALHALGSHYPGTDSSVNAEKTGLPLWASEEASNYNNNIGGGCWARTINQNYVNGNMTSSIAWNLISAYSKGFNWYRCGLMNAMQPWVGSYGTFGAEADAWSAGPMIWASAHTTQFTEVGSWSYLATGALGGSGLLLGGGSYVTLKNFATGDFTIVIEKLSTSSACIRPGSPGPSYGVMPERATLWLRGGLAATQSLQLWRTHWAFGSNDTTEEFSYQGDVPVVGGALTIDVDMNSVYTLTTLTSGRKGSYGIPPQPSLFPNAWTDDFEGCVPPAEAAYVCDMSGAMECADSGDPLHGVVLAMMTPLIPVPSGGDLIPHSFIGALDTVNASIIIDARLPEGGGALLIGLRGQHQNFDEPTPNPIVGALLEVAVNNSTQSATFSLWPSAAAAVDGNNPILTGLAPVRAGVWYTYRLDANGSTLRGWVDGAPLFDPFENASVFPPNGHALLGAPGWGNEVGLPQFDNLHLYASYSPCGVAPSLFPGAHASIVQCSSEAGIQPGAEWSFNASAYGPTATPGFFMLTSAPNLCLAATVEHTVELAVCDESDASQSWLFTYVNALSSQVASVAQGLCLDNAASGDPARAVIGTPLALAPCSGSQSQSYHFDTASAQIVSVLTSTCVGVC